MTSSYRPTREEIHRMATQELRQHALPDYSLQRELRRLHGRSEAWRGFVGEMVRSVIPSNLEAIADVADALTDEWEKRYGEPAVQRVLLEDLERRRGPRPPEEP